MCGTSTPISTMRVVISLLPTLDMASPPHTVYSDPLLVVDLYHSAASAEVKTFEDTRGVEGPSHTFFVLVLAPLSRAGVVEATQSFLRCSPVQGLPLPPFRGLIVKCDRVHTKYDVGPSHMRRCLGKDQAPMLDINSQEEFARSLVAGDGGAGNGFWQGLLFRLQPEGLNLVTGYL